MMFIYKNALNNKFTECFKYNSTNTKRREKILERILTPTGFEPASPRLSRPGSLTNCTYNILFNISLYRCFKMYIINYFQIFKK